MTYIVGRKDYQQELDYLNSVLKGIAESAKQCDEREKSFAKQFKIDDETKFGRYVNPIYSISDTTKDNIKGISERIVSWIIKRWHKELCPNVKLEENKIVDFRKNNMLFVDIRSVMDKFEVVYIRNAIQLSLDNILKESKKLVRYKWDKNLQNVTSEVSHILKGKRVQLHRYNDGYGNFDETIYFQPEVQALLKLANIVLHEENPVLVTDDTHLMDFKWFKNGRLDVICNNEDDAKQLAEVLINGFNKKQKFKVM